MAKADAVAGFMHEVGWSEVIKPALLKERERISQLLVATVLSKDDPKGYSKEQLAGMIFGIDRVIKVFEDTIKRGATALEQLESQGFTLTAVNL